MQIFTILLVSSSLLVAGCTSYSTGAHGSYAPSYSNGFTGLIAWELEEQSEILRAMHLQCANYGGLNLSSVATAERPYNGKYFMNYRSYRCNGINTSRPSTAPATFAPQALPSNQPSVVSNPLTSSEADIQIDKKQKPILLQSENKIEEAKKKCLDLGFKSGTEKFGQCVLKLSK
jgi:hypothetical protein